MHRACLTLLAVIFLGMATPAVQAQRPGFGELYYDGDVVRTLVPPAAFPIEGVDPLYRVVGGVEGQLGVASVAPGDSDYHGGHWAVFTVTWNVAPYLLTSEAEVILAAVAGDVSVVRTPEGDFLCPIQP